MFEVVSLRVQLPDGWSMLELLKRTLWKAQVPRQVHSCLQDMNNLTGPVPGFDLANDLAYFSASHNQWVPPRACRAGIC